MKYFIRLILICITGYLYSQEKILTLSDCIDIGKTNSPSAKIAKSEFESSRLGYESFKTDLGPKISFGGQVPNLSRSIREFDISVDDTLKTIFIPQNQSNSNVGISISQSIPYTGGRIFTSSSITRHDDFSDEHIVSWQATPFTVGYSQPLFKFNNLKWMKTLEFKKLKLAEQKYLEDMEDIASDITNLFFTLYISKIQLDNAKFNIEVNDTILAISKGRYAVGKIAENDLLRSELASMNSQNTLERNRLNYQRNYEALKLALGMHQNEQFQIILPEKLSELNIDPDFVLQQARENRSQYLSFDIQEITADKNVDEARKNRWFSADIYASVGYNQTADEFDDLYKDPLKTESFSLGFEFPLTQKGKKLSYLRSLQDQEKTRQSIFKTQSTFEQQLEYQVKEFQLLTQQLEIASRSDTIAILQFKVAKERYLIGKIDISNLFFAQNDLDNTHRQYYQTLKDYWVAYYRLRQMTLYDFEHGKKITL